MSKQVLCPVQISLVTTSRANLQTRFQKQKNFRGSKQKQKSIQAPKIQESHRLILRAAEHYFNVLLFFKLIWVFPKSLKGLWFI